jgi:hypothetical protein
MVQRLARTPELRSQQSWKNPNELRATTLPVYIGARIAYNLRRHPAAPFKRRRSPMATKQSKKPTKKLSKAKELQPTKPLSKFASGGDRPVPN